MCFDSLLKRRGVLYLQTKEDAKKGKFEMKEEKRMKNPTAVLEKYTSKTEAKELLEAVFYCAVSYLFGCAEMMFGVYPLGVAFMCTVRRHVPFAVMGAVLSAFACGAPISVSLTACAVSSVFRYALMFAFNGGKIEVLTLNDSLLSRICAVSAGLLSSSALRMVSGGFTYYDLLSCVFNVLFGAFMVYAYSLVTDEKNRYTQKYEAGVGAVFFSLVSSLDTLEILGMSCGITAAFVLPLYAARKGGALRGAVMGFLCGAALDISLCPMFGAVGFVGGVLCSIPVSWCASAAVVSSLLCGYYMGGVDALLQYFPEAIVSLFVYIPLEKMRLLPPLRLFRGDAVYTDDISPSDIATELKSKSYKEGLTSLSKALYDISEVMCALSENEKRPSVHEICELCEKEFSSFCKKCSMKKLCFPEGIRGNNIIRNTAQAIYEKRALTTDDLPEKIKTNCYFSDKITVSLNIKLAEYTAERLKNNKTEVMAEDYRALSQLIGQTVQTAEEKNEINTELTEKLRRTMLYKELFSNRVAVYGRGELTVIACGADTAGIKRLSEEVRKNFSKILGVTLSPPELTLCGDYTAAVFSRAQKLSAECASVQCIKDGESINGDNIFSFTHSGKLHVCICDGMGSGRLAALTSKTAGIFLQRMLRAGCNTEGALKMLNHFVRSKAGECFTTVDLMTVDLVTGGASFTKSGAPASYVVRDGRIFRLACHTPPVGIMAELCAERIDFVFKSGDLAVMVSDGISDADDPLVWLYNMLTYESDVTAEQLCEKILQHAQTEGAGDDDVTVCAVRIQNL